MREGGDAHASWGRLGFAASPWVCDYDADPRVMAARSAGLLEWCVQSGRVPADGAVRPATPADAAAMAAIECAALGGVPWQACDRLRAELASPRSRALVVVRDHVVRGFCTATTTGPGTLRVDSHVVDPAFRGGWAETMLRHWFFERTAAEGIERLLFSASELEPNTRNLARRAKATVVRRTAKMLRAVAVPGQSRVHPNTWNSATSP